MLQFERVPQFDPFPGILYVAGPLDGLRAMHEIGHAAGLDHRGTYANQGNIADQTAVMHGFPAGGGEFNRYEKSVLEAWAANPTFWNE